ncbi:PKD domain-containing protein [Candidatus Peregrinibacteria bacterium]|nr:MAG: PKD domain-containing protein [Candidatus Peregrinibacteria bacterium]
MSLFLLGLIPFFLLMGTWLFLFNLISTLQVGNQRVKAEIVVVSPTDLADLEAPVEVTFSSENVVRALQNSGLSLNALRWDFDGDGIFETIPNDFVVSYLYNRKGNYAVSLQAQVAGEDQARVYTYPLIVKDALFLMEPASGTAPLTVEFDARHLLQDTNKIQSLDWDFDGDGTYDLRSGRDVQSQFIYRQAGTYRVHLRVVDQNNVVQNYYRELEVKLSDEPLLTADIQVTPGLQGPPPFQVRLDGSASSSLKGKITSYEWDFGDGTPSQSGRTLSHTFTAIGTYQVSLTVRDDTEAEATYSVTVDVSNAASLPQAIIETTPALNANGGLSGTLPLRVTFNATRSRDSSGDIVNYEWNIGGITHSGPTLEYTFERAGSFEVQLTVLDADGNESTASVPVTIEAPGVVAVITALPTEGTAPLNVSFDASTSSTFEGDIVSYEWDFGDGTPKSITGATITHRFAAVGTYLVTLRVTTSQNKTATATQSIYVREVPLRACIEPSRTQGPAPLTVTFDAKCSTGAIAVYDWNFGDGDVAQNRKVAHTFDRPGTYQVTLQITDDKNNINEVSEVIVVEGQLR